jgi:hypothetical protein
VDFAPRFAQSWRQGEHVGLVGPTGAGKTTLALQLLRARDYVVILASKPRDRTLSGLRREGYTILRAWPPPNDQVHRVVLWPKWRNRTDTPAQAAAFRYALDRITEAGSWCVFADDTQHLTDTLGLRSDLRTMWTMARALGISVVGGTQRPRWVPREMWGNSTHLFLWQANDRDDIRALAGLGAANTDAIRSTVEQLPPYHALYVNTRTGGLVTVNLNRKVNQ